MSASILTGTPLEEYLRYKKENDSHHPHRKRGKVAELASGYGGGLGAWKAFGADEFMTDEEIQDAVRAWRAASPMVTALWWGLQDAALAAITNPGYCYSYRGLSFGVSGDVLYCQLPSGRRLTYHQPRIYQKTMPWGKQTTCVTYMGWNSNYLNGPVGWMRLETYGPKLTENVVQAVSRDILAHSMTQLDAAGYPIVLHVHDEIVAEVPQGWGSVGEFEQIMGRMPVWAVGWPVRAAGGWRGRRYRKE
jgi:DNA polymerase